MIGYYEITYMYIIYIIYIYTKILEVNLFAFAYRLFRRDFSPLDGTYCMGTHSFLQPYIHFVLIWEGFMDGQSWCQDSQDCPSIKPSQINTKCI